METNETLSAGAELMKKTLGLEGSIADYLKEHPEALEYLDEFVEWRSNEVSKICQDTATPETKHSLKDLVSKR